MSPALPSRRRADRFDDLVSGRTTHVSATDLEELRDLVDQLRALPEVAPRPEFSSDLRARLMAEADTALVPLDPTEARLRMPPRRSARDRRIATVLGGAALLGATTSMAVAAQSALPGDSLYPVKRVIEDARAGFGSDDTSRGERLLANATGRLDELSALVVRGTDAGIAATPSTLSDFTSQSVEASEAVFEGFEQDGDPGPVGELRAFTADSMDQLLALEAQLPAAAHDELVEAARTLTEIDDRAHELCPTCEGGITEIPRLLLSSAANAGVASVTVPSAVRPRRPAAPAKDEQDGPAGVTLPDVDADDLTSATGEDSDDVLDRDDEGDTGDTGAPDPTPPTLPTDIRTQDPITELAETLTSQSGRTSTGSGPRLDTRLDETVGTVLDGVGDVTGSLLD